MLFNIKAQNGIVDINRELLSTPHGLFLSSTPRASLHSITHSLSPDPHGEGIDVLVQLVQQADGLDDHVVHTVHVELHLRPGIAVSQAELSLGDGRGRQTVHQLVEVETNPTGDFCHHAPCNKEV